MGLARDIKLDGDMLGRMAWYQECSWVASIARRWLDVGGRGVYTGLRGGLSFSLVRMLTSEYGAVGGYNEKCLLVPGEES